MNAIAPSHRVLERLALTCPLGVRFVDAATAAPVREGLRARAWPADAVDRKIDAVVTPGGVHAFHGLPGLRRFENSSADDPWNPPPATRAFRVEVTDDFGRFLPCSFGVDAPARGLASFTDTGSPPWSEDGTVPLFSAPSRRVPGLAVVRAELHDLGTGELAAWAFVEAAYQSGGAQRIARGLADDKGRLALMFPFPEGQARGFGASPPLSGQGLPPQQWALALHFFHQPLPQSEKAADYSLRLNQPQAAAWQGASPLIALTTATLTLGRELDLGTLELSPA